VIELGKKVPAFRLLDATGATRTLAAFASRWVILDAYPKHDTPGCAREACAFTAGLAAFEALDAAVLGVRRDTPESHAKFAAKHGWKVTRLSDPDHAMLEAYGAWGEKTLYGKKSVGVIRATVLIDPRGKVAHPWKKVSVDGHADAVRAKLAALVVA